MSSFDSETNFDADSWLRHSFIVASLFVAFPPFVCQSWISYLLFAHPKRKQTKRVLTNIYYSPQSKSSISLGGWSRYKTLPRFSSWKFSRYSFYPKPVKWSILFRTTPVIIILQVNSLTLNNLHYIVPALCKAAKTAQVKDKIEILVL